MSAEVFPLLCAGCRTDIDAQDQFADSEDSPVIELPRVDVDHQPGRLIAVRMLALAAARGLREAVAERPGLLLPATVVLGRYTCRAKRPFSSRSPASPGPSCTSGSPPTSPS